MSIRVCTHIRATRGCLPTLVPMITQGPEHKAQSYTLRAQLPPPTLTHSSYPHWHRHTHIFTQSHMISHPRHSHPPNIHTDSSLPSPETWVVSVPTGHLCPACNRDFEIVLQVLALQEQEGTRRGICQKKKKHTETHPSIPKVILLSLTSATAGC